MSLSGGGSAGCGIPLPEVIVRNDPQPYQVDESTYRRFRGSQSSFNRSRAAGPGQTYRDLVRRTAWSKMMDGDSAFSTLDLALRGAAETVGQLLSFADTPYDHRLESIGYGFPDADPTPIPGVGKYLFDDPAQASAAVKRAALFLGAELAGVTVLDRRWVYSDVWLEDLRACHPLELPEQYGWVVVLAVPMDFDAISTATTARAHAATGLGYSKAIAAAVSLARFISILGYHAIASSNDTALSIPMAIDAGLGEHGRSGLLITPTYGPRVRITKIITDLPLAPDQPITFGARSYCRLCGYCASRCPVGAIPSGAETWSGPAVSTNPGVLKWYVDGDKCLRAWEDNGAACNVCISVCPYNRPAPTSPVGLCSPVD